MARRILFAVHDWGLGHATRSLVLIRALLERGDAVTILMAESPGLALLRTELGDACEFHEYEDLPKPFSRYPAIFYLRMSLAVPRVWLRFELEQRLTERLVRARRIDAVVSDSSARRLVAGGAELLPLSFAAPDHSRAARMARARRGARAAAPADDGRGGGFSEGRAAGAREHPVLREQPERQRQREFAHGEREREAAPVGLGAEVAKQQVQLPCLQREVGDGKTERFRKGQKVRAGPLGPFAYQNSNDDWMTGAKLRRCAGQGPWRSSAARCSGVP